MLHSAKLCLTPPYVTPTNLGIPEGSTYEKVLCCENHSNDANDCHEVRRHLRQLDRSEALFQSWQVTRRDYVAIAAAFQDSLDAADPQDIGVSNALLDAARRIANVCSAGDPNFRRNTFLQNCGFPTNLGPSEG